LFGDFRGLSEENEKKKSRSIFGIFKMCINDLKYIQNDKKFKYNGLQISRKLNQPFKRYRQSNVSYGG